MEIKWKPGDLAWWVSSRGERFAVEVLGTDEDPGLPMVSFRLAEPLTTRLLRMVLRFRSPRRPVARMPAYQFQPRER
jgi:hypothetical protein